MSKICKPEYLSKVGLLTTEESERLLSRMGGKLPRRLEKDKLTREEALAIQMELEDEQLQHWRKMIRSLREKEEGKKKAKPKADITAKAGKRIKSPANPKAENKAKVPAKTAAQTGPSVTAKAKAPSRAKVAVKANTPSRPKVAAKARTPSRSGKAVVKKS